MRSSVQTPISRSSFSFEFLPSVVTIFLYFFVLVFVLSNYYAFCLCGDNRSFNIISAFDQMGLNPLPDDKILNCSKLKQIANDIAKSI